MTACGVCHSDLHVMMKGEIPFSSLWVIGHEITGEVVEHGPLTDHKIVKRFPVGSRVVGAFIMPCGTCSYCAKGHDNLCEDFFAYNRAKGTLYDGKTRLFTSVYVQAGSVGEIDINRLVRRKIKVIGSYGGRARQELPKVVKLEESGIFNLANAVSTSLRMQEKHFKISMKAKL
ncbi:hypothetical protein HID58_032216 [Brassica napus]|uniref:Alcohol dehydrogenase-like N-terminal domain-containing protein n=1 Tax=Brassica napus TaxID=3708 RepID=A0ABQ8BVR4_BRANA|nr:hypothetical protein HID58_032216 [Brassica napus]